MRQGMVRRSLIVFCLVVGMLEGCQEKHASRATSNSIEPMATGGSGERADTEATVANIISFWLTLLDAGQVEKSYDAAASALKSGVTKKVWTDTLKKTRDPLGACSSRRLISKQFTTSVTDAAVGEYVIVQYLSDFPRKKQVAEIVTAMHDGDGKWRVLSYSLK